MNPLLLWHALRGIAEHPLNRRRPISSVARFCWTHLLLRHAPGDICTDFLNGTKLLVPPQMKGAAHFVGMKLCEYEQMCFALHFLRPGDLLVDAGANIGAYTVLASGVAGADTVAFEPHPSTFKYLQKNILLNDLTNRAQGWNLALGRKQGTLRLTDTLGTENRICAPGDGSAGIEVKVDTLDEMLGRREPALIKIDVEGFEGEVLGGAAQALEKPTLRAIIIEQNKTITQYGFDGDFVQQCMLKQGFAPCNYLPQKRVLKRLPSSAEGNMIYVRDLAAVEAITRAAPVYRIDDHML